MKITVMLMYWSLLSGCISVKFHSLDDLTSEQKHRAAIVTTLGVGVFLMACTTSDNYSVSADTLAKGKLCAVDPSKRFPDRGTND